MRFVLLHGGPGFNSFAEQAILGPIFHAMGQEISFWNEPSRLRPEGDPFEASGAFARWAASAEHYVRRSALSGHVHLIAHSFAARTAMDIASRHTRDVASLVLEAPSLDLFATYTNVLRLAHEDLTDMKPEIASIIGDCLERTEAVLDEAMREGMLNVLHDDRLFAHYWADAGQLDASRAAQARPDGQFDVDSFFAVLADFGQRGGSLLSATRVTIPTLVLFGAQDRLTPLGEQHRAIEAAIPEGRIEVLDGCSHYAHLDRPRRFVDLVIDWAAASQHRATSERFRHIEKPFP